jgi:glyoxylase-like metal-dependent hydrolase (beta-lactamase superfamily II)
VRVAASGLIALLLVLAGPLGAQPGGAAPGPTPAPQPTPDWAKVVIKTTKVAGSVWLLDGQGGNIAVSAGPDGLLIVDDQFAPLADKIKAALAAIDPGKLAFVLNTHWHGDHTGGNPVFGLEALIVAHENVRRRLSTEQSIQGRTIPPLPAAGLPVITFGDGLTIQWNGESIRLIHVEPSHTDSDSLIYFPESNVLHMGDVYGKNRFPFVDIGSGGRVMGFARNIARVLDEFPADVKIIPGHGALASRADLELFQRMLTESIATVKAGIENGKSLEEIQRAGIGAEWKDWAMGQRTTQVWLESVYRSLEQER